jgi:hypothetical protein
LGGCGGTIGLFDSATTSAMMEAIRMFGSDGRFLLGLTMLPSIPCQVMDFKAENRREISK